MIGTDYGTLQEFIEAETPRLRRTQLPSSPLVHVLKNRLAAIDGLWLEFGVFQGTTITAMAWFAPGTVYGFDSFSGLPEDWRAGKPKGRYDMQGRLPEVPANVTLISGWFEDTLPEFLSRQAGPLALVHIDCDIYSSTRTVLTHLKERFVPGSILIFDEMFNYPGYEAHEVKAFYEFLTETGLCCEWLGMKGPLSLNPDAAFEARYYSRQTGTAVRILPQVSRRLDAGHATSRGDGAEAGGPQPARGISAAERASRPLGAGPAGDAPGGVPIEF